MGPSGRIGGQDAVDAEGNIVGIGDLAVQTEQVLRNLLTAPTAAGAGPVVIDAIAVVPD